MLARATHLPGRFPLRQCSALTFLNPSRSFAEDKTSVPKANLLVRMGSAIKREAKKVLQGCKLLYHDSKFLFKRQYQVLRYGDDLKLKERKAMAKTSSDMWKMIPFSLIIVIPFAELALPMLLFLFPNMIPSTFLSKSKQEAIAMKMLELRPVHAYHIHSDIIEILKEQKTEQYKPLLKLIRDTPHSVTKLQLMEYPAFFKTQCNFDRMDTEMLITLGKFLGMDPWTGLKTFNRAFIRPVTYLLQRFGFKVSDYWRPNYFPFRTIEWLMVRYQVKSMMKQVREEDRLLFEETLDTLDSSLLVTCCRERGIETSPELTNEKQMREQLSEWVLHSCCPSAKGFAPNEVLFLSNIFNSLADTIAIQQIQEAHDESTSKRVEEKIEILLEESMDRILSFDKKTILAFLDKFEKSGVENMNDEQRTNLKAKLTELLDDQLLLDHHHKIEDLLKRVDHAPISPSEDVKKP